MDRLFDIYYELAKRAAPRPPPRVPAQMPLPGFAPIVPKPVPTPAPAPVRAPKPPPEQALLPGFTQPRISPYRHVPAKAPEIPGTVPTIPAPIAPPARRRAPALTSEELVQVFPQATITMPVKGLPPAPKLPAPKREPVTLDAKNRPIIPASYARDKVPAAEVKAEIAEAFKRQQFYNQYLKQEGRRLLGLKIGNYGDQVRSWLDRRRFIIETRPLAYSMGLGKPTAMEGMLAISALSMVYLLLTGRKPQTNRPQVAQVVEAATKNVAAPTPVTIEMRTALQNANSAISAAIADPKLDPAAKETLPTYIQLLRDIDSDIAALAGGKLSLDSQATAAVYVSSLKRTEAGLMDKMRHLVQLRSYFAERQMSAQVLAVENLMTSISKFMMVMAASRGMA